MTITSGSQMKQRDERKKEFVDFSGCHVNNKMSEGGAKQQQKLNFQLEWTSLVSCFCFKSV